MGLFSGILKSVAGYLTDGWGGAAAAAAGAFGSMEQDSNNRAQVKNQMDFQKYMSDTAHQREVKDLNAAGLNPMLSARYGGASTPSGAAATMGNSAEAADRSSTSQVERRLINAQIAREESQTSLNTASAAKAAAETRSITSQGDHSVFDLEEKQYLKDWYKSWDYKGRRSAAESESADSDARLKDNEVRVMYEVNDLIRKHGYRTFDAALANNHFRAQVSELLLKNNLLPQSNAVADFYRTDFGKSIAPYLSSAESLGRVARDVFQFSPRYGRR